MSGETVPAMLRRIADEIEAAAFGGVPGAVVILDQCDGDVAVAGLGDADSYHALGLLAFAQAKLTRERSAVAG